MNVSLIILILCILGIVICAVGYYGNEYLFVMRKTMNSAIFLYKMHCLENKDLEGEKLIEFEDVRDWTFLECACPWMWEFERYLSKEKLMILKPFLKEAIKAERK